MYDQSLQTLTMADQSLADPISAPPLDADFFSNLSLPFDGNDLGDFNFNFDDIDDLLNSDLDPDEISTVKFPADVEDYSAPEDPIRVSDYPSPGPSSSQGSGNSGDSVTPALQISNDSNNLGKYLSPEIKYEEESNKPVFKRKKNYENGVSEIKNSKFPRTNSEGISVISDEDEKRKVRLMRNRESAQLSRQRKKHYVEELEDKVRAMQSTIQDLNARISYIMAENASLRQQANGVPPHGMYPPPPMGYPWVPYPPYMVKPQGSQVPLIPIPKLKPQQLAPAPKIKSKTKKVASVSLLGLLFFMVLFGGLVPMVNLKFSEMNEKRIDYFNKEGKVLTSVNGSSRNKGIGNEFVSRRKSGNLSEPLVASLYVPRNDKLVKIDGNLIIHSIMASEKAMATTKKSEETRLAVARNNMPNVIPISGRNTHPYPYRGAVERQRALGGEEVKLMSSADGKLQEWFMDGLAGPMLSSGMCSEVFQFDISGAIVPATSASNISSETQHLKNITTRLIKGRNRRIFPGAPLPLEANITEKPIQIDPKKDNFLGNNSSSMVVSVLVDPREAGDGDGDGVMGPKSLSRIFVVVLIDSVKYVTYSCMLPRIGSAAHLTT